MGDDQNWIRVAATGAAEAPPDRASVDLGVSVLGRSVDKASQVASSTVGDVLSAIEAEGVERSDIHTVAHSVRPEYDHSGRTRRLAGYRVSNVVRVTIRSVDRVGPVIDAATEAGGDHATVERIHFELADSDALERVARAEAWEKALGKAEQLAALAGRSLGPARSIDETSGRRPDPVLPHRAAAMAAPAETPIEGGTISVSIGLTVSFVLE
jgi:uncharacterized protein YggE